MTGRAASVASGLPVLEAAAQPDGIRCSCDLVPGSDQPLAEPPADAGAYRFERGDGHWLFGRDPRALRFIAARRALPGGIRPTLGPDRCRGPRDRAGRREHPRIRRAPSTLPPRAIATSGLSTGATPDPGTSVLVVKILARTTLGYIYPTPEAVFTGAWFDSNVHASFLQVAMRGRDHVGLYAGQPFRGGERPSDGTIGAKWARVVGELRN